MEYVPVVTEKKPKAKGKAKKKNAGSTKKSKSKAAKAEKGKKTETPKKKAEKTKKAKDPPKEDVAQGNSTVYQAGDYNMQRKSSSRSTSKPTKVARRLWQVRLGDHQ